jgi:hypothetical protein
VRLEVSVFPTAKGEIFPWEKVAWLFPWAKFLPFRDRKTPEKGTFLPAVFPLEKPSIFAA